MRKRNRNDAIFASAVLEVAFFGMLNHFNFYNIDEECGELYNKLRNRLIEVVRMDEENARNKRKKATQ